MTVRKTALSHILVSALLAGVMMVFGVFSPEAAAQLGRQVDNVATVTVDNNGEPLSFDTNAASFIIEARRTPSTIEFFRFAPAAPNSFTTQINGSDYNPEGNVPPASGAQTTPGTSPGDPFQPIGPPRTVGGAILDFSGDVALTPATRYLAGELMIVRVIDRGQNGDPDLIETVVITVTTSGGDEIVLRLYESGPNTGEFYGYMPSTRNNTAAFDDTLTTDGETRLTATYVDPFDSAEVSVDTALVDPFGRVFDSLTGELLDGVRVTIVDAVTGEPAAVFGVDGVSEYPSSLLTGSVVTDASGLQYELEDGEFLFPLMAPGDYRLLIETPAGYLFPSGFTADDFVDLDNAPFEIIPGSYGGVFTVEATGPLNFDVPLDPAGELVLTKEATTATAAVGDTIGYTIEVVNRDVVPAPVRVRDTLPLGLRYLERSVRANGGPAELLSVSEDGRTLELSAGVVRPGETVRLTYVATVSAGARLGEAVNTAIAVNTNGGAISNRAEAAVQIIEDLLRSRLTIIGRVAENACVESDEWARELEDGQGVAGVRLYMETGEYVVTDANGLYHFEGVTPGTHVVQVDEETLPEGYEPMVCEENSRYAGSAISKFVDATGGVIWRANFYLKKVRDVEVAADADVFDDATEYQDYDAEWLETADPAPRWVYPDTRRTPSSRSVNVGIVHPKRHTVELSMNGARVPGLNYSGRDSAETGLAEISRWRGLDILEGENRFVAQIKGPTGELVETLTESIWYVTDAEQATLIADQSSLVADGLTNPVIAVRIEDAAGRPVHKGRIVQVDVSAPYTLKIDEQFENEAAVSALTVNTGVTTGPDGTALIELEPTLHTGRIRVNVQLDTGRIEQIDAYLTPEKRDWILVGLAEGSAGLQQLDDDVSGSDTLKDGRVAFFAKGLVKGDWLLTLAVDTAKRRGGRDGAVFEDYIDPNAYYTLYGDQTYQYSDAESRYPLYVKLEKDTVQLLFGDYNTDLNDTELARYSRRLSGLKGIYEGKHVSATGFAAETNQGFVKDEIAADGTSGVYRLSAAPIVRNSEIITVETRERLRPDQILSIRTYVRYVDYEIDYITGEIIFRHPVNVTDASFNPNVIVADYEVAADAERNVTAGGRLEVHTADRRVEAGLTYVREEGSDTIADATSDVAALDVTAQLSETTEIRAEVATSSREAETGTERANAYLLEAVRQSEALTVSGYLREDEAGFGLGQQGSNTAGARRLGADLSARISESVSESTGFRQERFFDAQVFREENLATDAVRDVAEAAFRQESQVMGLSVGLKGVREDYADDVERSSLLVTGSARKSFADHGLTLTATHEQPLASSGDEATLYPQRTLLGADKELTSWATLNLRHEINNGADASGNNTIAGVTVRPWAGGEVRASADAVTQDSGRRLGATVGVDQAFRINDNWSASLGAARRARIDGGDAPRDVTPDAAISPFEDGVRSSLVQDEAYTSLYAGAGYRADAAAGSGRVEYRDSTLGKRWTGTFGAAREATEKLSYAGAARVQTENNDDQPDRLTAEARLGAAYRPSGEGLVVLNRFDVKHENIEGEFKQHKLVNNLGMNWMMTERTQAAVFHGLKYQESDIGDISTSGFTQLVGGELRHDITRRVDVGFSGSVLVDHETETSDYAFGPSIGFTPAKNVWASVGYNFVGFTDNDFQAAEYSRDGVYIKLRVKFDQHTAEGLLERISPNKN